MFSYISSSVKKVINAKKIKREGGQLYSATARKIAQKYNTTVDLYSYGSCFNKGFAVSGKCNVGRYCSIASDVHYLGGNHPMDMLSTSAIFYNKKFSGYEVEDITRYELNIGNDVWIGHGVLITAKCHNIGNGAVIGAGSVVTKDVPPYSIVAGNPAKVIRYRFDENTINRIEESKWWELSPDELMDYYEYMNNPSVFCEKIAERSLNKE